MNPPQPIKTISQVFREFLTDQKARIGPQTFSKYETVISLYTSYLERYWPGHSGTGEYDTITKTGGTFCGTFGPEDITAGYGEFLGYFMPTKVMCGRETMQAAGTVTKKLAKWLVEKGYVADTEYAQERAGAAAKGLPKAQTVFDLLTGYLDENAPAGNGNKIEDHFWIERIEPGKLWLNPVTAHPTVIGPVPVPQQVTELCKVGWDIGGAVVKVGRNWRLVEVWSVSP